MPDSGTLGPFSSRDLISFLERPDLGGPVRSCETGGAVSVAVPDLVIGRQMIAHIPITEEHLVGDDYTSVAPWTCIFDGAVVHGPVGVIQVGDELVASTIPGERDHHGAIIARNEGFLLPTSGVRHTLSGSAISLLGGGTQNYYHWMADGIGRMSAAPAALVDAARHVLVPILQGGFQRESLILSGLAAKNIVEIGIGDRVETEMLLVPCNMAGEWRPHPRLRDYFVRIGQPVPAGNSFPKKFYIDRRHGPNRRLANEDELIASLARYDVVAIRLEELSLPEQILLFRGAELIVAPHGAGLTNILFASSDCRLIELQMNTYVHWMFRLFAAISGVRYDCVIGRQLPDDPARAWDERTIHQQRWHVSVMHVLAALERIIK